MRAVVPDELMEQRRRLRFERREGDERRCASHGFGCIFIAKEVGVKPPFSRLNGAGELLSVDAMTTASEVRRPGDERRLVAPDDPGRSPLASLRMGIRHLDDVLPLSTDVEEV